MNREDLEYYRRRIAAERVAAERAASPQAAASHRQLAEEYASLIIASGATSVDDHAF